jgi:hypothetical protein
MFVVYFEPKVEVSMLAIILRTIIAGFNRLEFVTEHSLNIITDLFLLSFLFHLHQLS